MLANSLSARPPPQASGADLWKRNAATTWSRARKLGDNPLYYPVACEFSSPEGSSPRTHGFSTWQRRNFAGFAESAALLSGSFGGLAVPEIRHGPADG